MAFVAIYLYLPDLFGKCNLELWENRAGGNRIGKNKELSGI
jgi:hypothetical protein